ncbi:MAG: 4-hydroxy-tetrahydrodipicolinate reductase [Buchnera aphidicola (Eriosoma harunire)]
MVTKNIRIAISGMLGRIGSLLIQETQKIKNIQLTIAISKNIEQHINNDVTFINQLKNNNITIVNSLNEENNNFDILIDFTHPSKTIEYLKYCIKHNKKIVIGTTGFNKEEKEIINAASQKIGLVYSSNFSIGMNTMYKLIQKTTENIGNNSDIAIIESHHNQKKDKPSGTAITIKEIILKTLNSKKKTSLNYNKINRQQKKTIDISSLRLGDVHGDHTVIYSSIGERIEITHRANNKLIFAHGAIQAAIWLYEQKPGLYTMENVLNTL